MILKTDEAGREIGMGSSVSQSAPALHGADTEAEPAGADWLAVQVRPGTPGCTNPDCGLYPYYGVAPHECFYKRGEEFTIGQSIGLPPSLWPANSTPDLEPGETPETINYPNACGVYVCPTCLGREAASPAERPVLPRETVNPSHPSPPVQS